MITFFAPASTCARALVASVKKPVDSITTSAPMSPHFSADGSRSAKAGISWSPTWIAVSVEVTSASRRPRIESNLSRRARDVLSVRSLTPTISMSPSPARFWARTARKKLRPMRPNPLIPTRTVTAVLLASGRGSLSRPYRGVRRPHPPSGVRASNPGSGPGSGLFGQHLRGQRRLGVGDAELLGPLVGHRQQPADPAGDGVLGQHRVTELTELLEGGLLVLEAEPARLAEVVGDLLAEDLQGAFDACTCGHGRARGATQVGVVEVGQPVGGGPDLAAHPALFPGEQRFMCSESREELADGVAVADDDAVDAADLSGLGRDAEPAGRPDQREGRLGAGAGDLERARAAGLGE